jgi:transportin-1
MEPLVDEWMPLVQVELHKRQDVSLSNNVIWTLAEAVLKLGVQVRPYVNDFILNLVIIANMSPTPSIMENIAYCICNLGFVCPEVVAPQLPILGSLCFGVLPTIPDKEERETAALGLFTMIGVNPVGVDKAKMVGLLYSLEFKAPLSHQLREAIHLGVTNYCAARNVSFASMLEDLPNDFQETLKTKYEFLMA